MKGLTSRAHWSVLAIAFYDARYIVGIFVTGIPNEAHYSLISFCNILLINVCYRYVGHPYNISPICLLHSGTSQDLVATISGAASWNQTGFGSGQCFSLATYQGCYLR
jgi:hypothetical protein